jgi:periplasmic divalent cation tolerance protein
MWYPRLPVSSRGQKSVAIWFVYTTVKDKAQGLAIGRALVEERLAACISLWEGMTSIYRWQGAVEEASEAVLAKTTEPQLQALVERVKALHSCIRAALFFPLQEHCDGFGNQVETAIFAQWFHWLTDTLHYGRWDAGAGEVDRSETRSPLRFLTEHPKCDAGLTCR